ncbi:hypothetical protein I203_105062 [Kwoniella mangroviensis CBS 8507]|uniref:uncharacterized protein n=1 Tax=Kwoniella mangroviensis CBS 8507 TaxID=1296122 RepID=UPI00080D5D54|nr:uncharacterized protein I203_08409 [Kwoniella mangroviensis CBS 8507]OCF62514.1 hypothetical protein I203_08409 [Kwoniella mangroviensis CBS 8507]
MIKSPLLTALLPTIALIPNTMAVNGNVKINFPSDTSSQLIDGSLAVNQNGGSRSFPADQLVSKSVSFYWKGPLWSLTTLVVTSVSSSATVSGPVAATEAVAGSNGSGQSQVSWQQTCKVSVDDQFDGDVEFTLQVKEAGFKGSKDKHATIVCDQPLCLLPEGEKCEGRYVIPFVDSVSSPFR